MICQWHCDQHSHSSEPVAGVVIVHFCGSAQYCDGTHEAGHQGHGNGKDADVPASHEHII